mmetsp:Transcript_41599/g.109819  ORF Transcript_41599/g.109819 Transcript_41599/m.109819 type:complete len:272 (-) Transcript_41599:458-1273(-)
MPRRRSIISISFWRSLRSSLSRLMRFSSRIFHNSYSSASFLSSSSSISSASDLSLSLTPAASASWSCLSVSMRRPLDSAFLPAFFSSSRSLEASSSASKASFSLTVSRADFETNTGLRRAPRLGSSSSLDSSSLSSSSCSISSSSSSGSSLSISSSCFRRARASSRARSRRDVMSSTTSPSTWSSAGSFSSPRPPRPPASRSSSSFIPLTSSSSFSSSPSSCSLASSRMRASCMRRCRSNLSEVASATELELAAAKRFRRLPAASSMMTAA